MTFAMPRPARGAFRLLAALGLLQAVVLPAPAALGQCTLTSGPNRLDPGSQISMGWGIKPDHLKIFESSGRKRLLTRATYGYVIYDLSSPASPSYLAAHDIHKVPGYERHGDGQTTVNMVGVSPDGSRLLVGYNDTHGTLIMTPSGDVFTFGGDFGPIWTGFGGGGVIVRSAGRSIAIAAPGPNGAIVLADATTPFTGTQAQSPLAFPKESFSGTPSAKPTNTMRLVTVGAKQYLVYPTMAGTVVVADVTTPGPVGSIASGYSFRVFSVAELGFSSGAVSTVEPLDLDGSLYLVSEGRGTSGATLGVSIVKASLSGVLDSPRVYLPPFPYSGSGASPGFAMSVVSTANGSIVFFWESGSNGLLKLFSLSTSDWTTDLSPAVTFSTSDTYTTPGTEAMAILNSGENVYIYAGSSGTASAIGLRCSSAASPASADLSVHPDPCPGGGASCPLAEGASVFVGDKLRIVPTVSPSPTTTELTDWRFDFDFHDGNANDSGATYPRLKAADLFYTSGQTAPPSQIALVGPCDPTGSSGVDTSTGTNCWASVLGNANYGGPDFTGPFTVASEGTSKTLTLALEAQNAQNQTGTSGVKKFNLSWKIPKVKLKGSSVLLGQPIEDGSEGKPAATGFRWYFATLPDTPPTERQPLVEDTGCTGPACNHAFASKGVYDYWVTVPYSTGYKSEDCGDPCIRSRGQVSVTDVVLAFTAPSAVSKSSTTFTVTDGSTRAPSVTPCPATSSGYEYSVCDAGSGACSPTSWLPISFPTPGRQASIPTPSPTSYPGTYWLRLRYSYSTTSDCSSPLQLTWQPGTVAGNPDAWQFAVTNVIPTIWLKLPNGADVCPLGLPGCPPFPLEHGATIKAYAYIGSVEDPNPPAITWDFGHSPAAGSGQGAQHTYTNPGTSGVTYYITLNGYGVPVTETVTVTPQTTTTPPSVNSVSASTYSPTVGQNVTFVCNASAGTGGAMTYAWTFSDGGTGSGVSTSHAFGAAGTYSAQCRVTNSAGTATGATTVTVGGGGGGGCGVTSDYDLYDVNTGGQISLFSTGFDVASGQRVRFVGRSAVPASGVTWNFGDSTNCGTNPCEKTFTYTGTGYRTYNASLAFSSCNATHAVNVSGVTGPPPVPNLDFGVVDATTLSALPRDAFGYMQATSGQSLRFTATGAQGGVTWNFGDASATTTEASPTHTFNTATDASYTVRVTDSHTTPRSKTYVIQVAGSAGAPLSANFTYKYADNTAVTASAVQPNKAVKFTSVDLADTYIWDFGDGTPLGTGSPVEHTFTRGGNFAVAVTVARAGVTTTTTNPPKVLTVVPPPEPLQWMLGGMAFAPGLEGTFWQSDVTIYNPSPSAPMRVELAFLDGRREPDVEQLSWIQRSINPQSSDTLTNVLYNVFSQAEGAYGSILVKGVEVPVNPVITGKTYNRGGGGTYGLSVPAVRVSGGVQPQAAAASNVLVGLRQTPPGGASAGFRTNLALSNLKSDWATVDLTFYGKQGQQLGQRATWTLAPLRVFQVSEVLKAAPPLGAGYSGAEEEYAVVVDVVAGSSVFPYATVIENRSGDPIVVTPQPRPSPSFRLPGVIRAQGQNQTVWRSDVVLYNPSSSARKVRVAYSYVSDRFNPPRRSTDAATIDLAPKQALPLYDFVASWLQLSQSDAVNYTDAFVDVSPDPTDAAPSEPILAMGRTYNDQPTGSVGLQLGAFTGENGIHATSSDKRLVLSGLASGTSFRSNVVVLLASGAPTTGTSLTLRVFNSYGLEVKRMEGITLDSVVRPVYQIPDSVLFANVSGDRSQMTVVVDTVAGSVPVAAYATVIDQLTGDATYLQAVPTP